MSKLICDIVTPAEKLYSEDAYMVIVPGVEGEMGFLEKHEPLVSLLRDGAVRVQKENGREEKKFAILGGYVEVTGSKVIVLADRACSYEDIDAAEVNAKLSEAENQYNALSEEDQKGSSLKDDIVWYKTQLKIAENN